MSARDIALALAGRHAHRLPGGAYLVCCPVPSHGKGRGDRNPSLRLADGDVCVLVHCYSGCDRLAVLDALRRRGLLDGKAGAQNGRGHKTADNVSRFKREDEDAERIKRAQKICDAARDPRGTLVEDYLRSRNGLVLDDAIAGHVPRFHPRCPWGNKNAGKTEFLPALIACFRSIDDNAITAIHRIRLDQPERWPKAERRMLGPVHRAAVKLDSEVGGILAIGEDIETCMAARQLMATGKLERASVWALGSAGGIERFPVLPNVRTLRIICENDRTNEGAREQCGQRWHSAGRRVRVIKPDLGFNDLNDVLRRDIS